MNTNLEAIKNANEGRNRRRVEMQARANDAMKEAEHGVILQLQQREIKEANWRSCLNCLHWSEPANPPQNRQVAYVGCTKWKALPPPAVIVHGCKDWEDDIPF
jgi:hypothetical protein